MNTTNSATGTVRHRTIDSTSAKVYDDESIGCVCFWSVPLVPRKKRAVRLRTTTTDVVVPVGFEVEKTGLQHMLARSYDAGRAKWCVRWGLWI